MTKPIHCNSHAVYVDEISNMTNSSKPYVRQKNKNYSAGPSSKKLHENSARRPHKKVVQSLNSILHANVHTDYFSDRQFENESFNITNNKNELNISESSDIREDSTDDLENYIRLCGSPATDAIEEINSVPRGGASRSGTDCNMITKSIPSLYDTSDDSSDCDEGSAGTDDGDLLTSPAAVKINKKAARRTTKLQCGLVS